MKLKLSVISLLSALTASGLGLHSASATENQAPETLNNALADQLQYVLEAQDRYIIKFRSAARADLTRGNESAEFDVAAATDAVTQIAGRVHKIMEKRGVVVATLDRAAVTTLSQRADVESISADPVRMPLSQTVPYSYAVIQATQLVQSDTTAKKVCVVDSGIDGNHEDLPNRNSGLTGSTTGSQVGNWYNDGYGHGTHVAGTIGAYNNGFGSVGVYPGVNMHIVKVFNDNGSWTYASSIIEAIDQCAEAGAEVVNMSLGGPGSSNYESQALAEYESQGILMVAAAGNDGNSTKSYPASYDAVMSVGALGTGGGKAGYSQYNEQVEITAPGTRIYSTRPGDGYTKLSGTSMATPHVAGGAALVWSYFPQCTNAEVRSALTATALDKGDPGRDDYYGHGLLQVDSAYAYLDNSGCGDSQSGNETVVVEETDLAAGRYQWNRFAVTIPEGTNTFTVEIAGGTGNANLYVKEGSIPKYSSFDCRSNEAGNNELCTFEAPEAGEWHIGIRARTAYEGVTLKYTLDGGQQPAPEPDPDPDPGTDPVEVVQTDLAADTNGWERFTVAIPEGATTFNVEIANGTGNADLYVKFGSKPKYRSYDCRPNVSGNTEMCSFDAPEAGVWHMGVRAGQPYTGVTLTYSYN